MKAFRGEISNFNDKFRSMVFSYHEKARQGIISSKETIDKE